MVINRLYWIALVACLGLAQKGYSHEGHNHDEGAPQDVAITGPVTLSATAKKNLELETAEATVRAIEKTIKASGTVQAIPGSRENVSSKISGKVSDIRFTLGQYPKRGQVLMTLESRQLSENPIKVNVIAPRNGKVVKLNVIQGDAIEPGTSLLELADYAEVYAVAKVFESQIGSVAKGMSARVYSPALKNKELDSKVEIIGSEVNPQSRTVEVWLRVKNSEERLKINMTVNIYFLANREEETITIPRSAVLGNGGDKFVFVEEGNNYTRTSVVTGIENDKWIEIVEGLAPGDIVVTRGNYQLQFAKPTITPQKTSDNGASKPAGK